MVGTHGRGTWSGHMVGAPPTNMSPPAPAGDPPGYPPRRPGTWSHTLTHTTHTHTHTPKDIIRTQKINLLGKNARFQKPGPVIILERKTKTLGHEGSGRASVFFEKWSIFPRGTALWRVRASKPRIVTINNIDGVSGLRTAHTRWAPKYPSFFDQILKPLLGCKKPIMSPSKIWLHFFHLWIRRMLYLLCMFYHQTQSSYFL